MQYSISDNSKSKYPAEQMNNSIPNKTLKQKNKICLKDHTTNPSWHHQTKTSNTGQHKLAREREVFNITVCVYLLWYNIFYMCVKA